MGYPHTYQAIKGMVRGALLETRMARDIVRKGAPEMVAAPEAVEAPASLAGQYARVSYPASNQHSQYGIVVSYTSAAEMQFPAGDTNTNLRFYGSFEGVTQMRMLATVTQAAASGCELAIAVFQEEIDNSVVEVVDFDPGPPVVPLDAVGLHVSGWKTIEWSPDSKDGIPAQANWKLLNPTGLSGTVGVGLCQLQIRAA
jgi:hypothetical protein